jgi:DNA polymerase III alpha subunit
MLDGAARIGDLVDAAVADGQPALGITDHGNMYGVLDFYAQCRAKGINPVIGTEAYMAGESRHERPVRRGKVDDTGGDVEGGEKLYYHLTLLAETTQGYRNLMKLSSAAYLEGYYYKPRVDWELLERHQPRSHRHHRLPRAGWCCRRCWPATTRRRSNSLAGCRTSSGATACSWSSRTTGSPPRAGPIRR